MEQICRKLYFHLMKTLLLLIVLLPFISCAQQKGDNQIILHDHISFNKLKSTLFNNGYTLINSDSNYITTYPTSISKSSITLKMMILRTDTSVSFKGYYKSNDERNFEGMILKDDFALLQFNGSKRGDLKITWHEMDRIAKLLSGDISYGKQ